MPTWLPIVATISLAAAICCAALIAIDILRGHKQHMAVMNFVWPITALWSGPLGLWAYYKLGRGRAKSFPASVALATTHCGAGCALGDILAEWIHVVLPFTIAGVSIFGAWALDYAFAFTIGIAFQYFSIVPMRQLPPGKGLIEALKADSLSLTSWQVGMYGWMAIMRFAVFDKDMPAANAVFWFLMQIGMAAGFLTSYPVNWWLVKSGVKERM